MACFGSSRPRGVVRSSDSDRIDTDSDRLGSTRYETGTGAKPGRAGGRWSRRPGSGHGGHGAVTRRVRKDRARQGAGVGAAASRAGLRRRRRGIHQGGRAGQNKIEMEDVTFARVWKVFARLKNSCSRPLSMKRRTLPSARARSVNLFWPCRRLAASLPQRRSPAPPVSQVCQWPALGLAWRYRPWLVRVTSPCRGSGS